MLPRSTRLFLLNRESILYTSPVRPKNISHNYTHMYRGKVHDFFPNGRSIQHQKYVWVIFSFFSKVNGTELDEVAHQPHIAAYNLHCVSLKDKEKKYKRMHINFTSSASGLDQVCQVLQNKGNSSSTKSIRL